MTLKPSSLACALPLLLTTCHAATVEKTTYNGHEAYRLSDAKTEAVIVPSLSGRVMRFGSVGGVNWMWNALPEMLQGNGYKNYGGDKTFVGPHPAWSTFTESLWPPQPTWDGTPHLAQVLPDGRLRTTGDTWRGFGVRVIREFSFNAAGEFVVSQTLEKLEGEPRILAIWPVTQLATPDAVYLPINEKSAYLWGYHPYGPLPKAAKVEPVVEMPLPIGTPVPRPGLLKITPTTGGGYKLGVDSPVVSIAAVKDGVAFVQRTEKVKAQYPNGAEGAGLTVEFYNHWEGGAAHYVELELMSPLYTFNVGDSKTLVTRWSLHTLPDKTATPEVISQLLQPTPN
ncbi:MAG TPA: hypothetical protein VF681_12210 [Abditibacteriaceae bacterium]|jgi:hypothetical protein